MALIKSSGSGGCSSLSKNLNFINKSLLELFNFVSDSVVKLLNPVDEGEETIVGALTCVVGSKVKELIFILLIEGGVGVGGK